MFEAHRILLGMREEMNLSIASTFLGVILWGGKDDFQLRDLAQRVGLPVTTVSRHLRYLGDAERPGKEGLKLVRVHEYPMDRRAKYVTLTPKGEKVRDQIEYALGGADTEH